jgi:hypothetical protein
VRTGLRAGRVAAAFAPALVVIALATGCSSKFQSFPFEAPEGARIQIWQSGRASRDAEARFQPGAGRAVSPEYHLGSPVQVVSSGESFALTYTSDLAACALTILSGHGKAMASAALPRTSGNALRFVVPLPAGSRIWGYQLSVPPGEASGGPGGAITLTGAGVLAFVHGFSVDPGMLTVDGSVEVLSTSASATTARLTDATRREMENGTWLLRLTLGDGAAGGGLELVGSDGAHASFDVNPASTPGWLDFARGSVPFLPQEVRFAGALRGLQVLRVPAEAPIPADLGEILAWDQASWRKPDYELFSWSRYPRVLVMDTASYAVQDAFFKRLAFFVEKAGHAGKLESAAALAGLHGYNAHDYRPEDLARFFTEASKDSPGLSTEESTLASILVENGVLKQTADGYAPGDGCILSISRSSSALLRSLLLTRESFHGLFFTMPEFRDATEREWASLSPDEQSFWVYYLGARDYDTTDHYLVVNEFQSYLLQQNRSGIWGFQGTTLDRMKAAGGRGAALARRIASSHVSSFMKAFDALDGALQSAGGPPGGETISVRRVEQTSP